MISVHPDDVLADLGDSFLRVMAGSIKEARSDLADMRTWRPAWFPTMSTRGLATIIHERVWAHLITQLDGQPHVMVVDSGPTREIQVGIHYRFRVKRHHADDSISTYPTQTAMEFYTQAMTIWIPGTELIKLAAGYRWDNTTREILAPVISYRDGKDNPIWARALSEPDGTADVTPIVWKPIDPSLPMVSLGAEASPEEGGSEK